MLTGALACAAFALAPAGAQAGTLTIAPSQRDFGSVSAAGSATEFRNLTVTNHGTPSQVLPSIIGPNAGEFQVTANGCGETPLADAETCVINVGFDPSTYGPRSATLVASNGGGVDAGASLTGIGLAADVSISPDPLQFPPTFVNQGTPFQTVTLVNHGNQAATGLTIGGIEFTAASASCSGGTVPANSSCPVSISFKPEFPGSDRETFAFFSFSNHPQISILLRGSAYELPNPALGPSSLVFPGTRVGGTSPDQTVTLTNPGGALWSIQLVSFGVPASDFELRTGTCTVGAFLAPGAQCTLAARFAPSQNGVAAGQLNVTVRPAGAGSFANVTRTVSLSGLGASTTFAVAPGSHDFGHVDVGDVSPSTTFTIQNTSPFSTEVGPLVGAPALNFDLSGDSCSGQTLAPAGSAGDSCEFDLSFSPSAAQDYLAPIRICVDGGLVCTEALVVSGSGEAPAVRGPLFADPGAWDFGPMLPGATSEKTFVLNAGSAPVEIGTIQLLGGTASFEKTADGCSNSTLPAGSECQITIRFTAPAQGAVSEIVRIDSDAEGAPDLISLSGSGARPVISVSPGDFDFGAQQVGKSSAARTFTVENHGAVPGEAVVQVAGGVGTAGDAYEKQADQCAGKTLQPAGSGDSTCTFQVVFTPGASGVQTGEVVIASAAADSPEVSTLTGSGFIPPESPPAVTPPAAVPPPPKVTCPKTKKLRKGKCVKKKKKK